ncbi:hypothetical protein BD626DRAFT_451367 [Schizophyllum amplum]|uniref:Uncharacterized protein n=1 Tax=Schizophyllum amplum TaxID=97359 RepID=A0A550CV52_9AGAR|nr:hypothetical protein BD626DRAFT_451367 [Auriculariopsis ampla]
MGNRKSNKRETMTNYDMSKPWTKPRQSESHRLRERTAMQSAYSFQSYGIEPATSSIAFSPIYPAAFVNFTTQSVSPEKLRNKISELRDDEDGAYYGIVATVTKPGATTMPATVHAQRLLSFVLHADKIDEATRLQMAALLNAMQARDLVSVEISLAGRSIGYIESAVFRLLNPKLPVGSHTLTHVSLCMSFASKKGLRTYLTSMSASYLVSLELQTNVDVKPIVLEALSSGHMLPRLQYLCLRKIKGLTPRELLDALRLRHDNGRTNPLHAEIDKDIDDDICKDTRGLPIKLEKACIRMKFH